MTGRVFLVSLFLSSTAFAIVPGPSQQLSSGPNDAVNPAISGNWVVWTVDTGQPNGLDVFALDLPAPPAVDVTPWPGGQSFDDVDGRYAVYIDDTDVAHVKVLLKDLTSVNAAQVMNIDATSGERPSVSNPGRGASVRVVYVRRGVGTDI